MDNLSPKIIRFIGDVHGYYGAYKTILKNSPYPTIQVGDMGIGFKSTHGATYGLSSANPPYDLMVEGKHKFIRGNHDNPGVCKKHTQFIPDGTYDPDYGIMYIGGGFSIDREFRTKDMSWWEDEEVAPIDWNWIQEKYKAMKPKVMVTHCCPTEVVNLHLQELSKGYSQKSIPSQTDEALQDLFAIHQPELWVYGHWHRTTNHLVFGTQFICVDELHIYDATIEPLK